MNECPLYTQASRPIAGCAFSVEVDGYSKRCFVFSFFFFLIVAFVPLVRSNSFNRKGDTGVCTGAMVFGAWDWRLELVSCHAHGTCLTMTEDARPFVCSLGLARFPSIEALETSYRVFPQFSA